MTLVKSLPMIALAVLVTACVPRPDKTKDKDAKEKGAEAAADADSRAFSRWIRSHVADYWTFAKLETPAVAPGLVDYLQDMGVIAGDAHLSNFSPLPVRLENGRKVMRYLNNDFDDAGRGPFVLDLARLLVTSKATHVPIETNDVVEAYAKGLNGEEIVVPPTAKYLLGISTETYYERADTELRDFLDKTGFKKKKSNRLQAYGGPITAQLLGPHLPGGMTVLEIVTRTVKRGGSADSKRFWILVRDGSGQRFVFELKQWQESGLKAHSQQEPLAAWIAEVRDVFWPGIDARENSLIEIPGEGVFWLRERRAKIVDPPYSGKTMADIQYVQDLTVYDAFLLGQKHGLQAEGKRLAKRLVDVNERTKFSEALKPFVRAYLTHAQALSSANPAEDDED